MTVGVAAPLIALALSGSIIDYFQQSVISPLRWSQDASGGVLASLGGILGEISEIAAPVFLPILLGVSLLALASRRGVRHEAPVRRAIALLSIPAFAVALIMLITNGRLVGSLGATNRAQLLPRILEAWGSWDQQFLLTQFAISGLLSIAGVIYGVWGHSNGKIGQHRLAGIVLLATMNVASFSQLHPTYDARHLWWGAVFASLTILSSLSFVTFERKFQSLALAGISVITILSAVIGSAGYLSGSFRKADAQGIFSGLLLNDDEYSLITGLENMFEDELPDGQNALFFVGDGGVSVVTGSFRSDSKNFVLWAYQQPRDALAAVSDGSFLVVSSGSLDALGYESFDQLKSTNSFERLACTSARDAIPLSESHCLFLAVPANR